MNFFIQYFMFINDRTFNPVNINPDSYQFPAVDNKPTKLEEKFIFEQTV